MEAQQKSESPSKRTELVNQAVFTALSNTFQSKDAGVQLQNAVSNYNFAEEMGTTDKILESFTKIANENAQQRVDAWLKEKQLDHIIAALDQHGLSREVSKSEETKHEVPNPILPTATYNKLAVEMKENEIESLRRTLEEKQAMLHKIRSEAQAYVQNAAAMREKLDSFAKGAHQMTDLKSQTIG